MIGLGRLTDDFLRKKLGSFYLLMSDVALAARSISASLLLPHPALSIIAFANLGFGLAMIVPIIYSSAGRTLPMASSIGF